MMADITWRPQIGDPTWIGWITVAAYLIAAWSCLRTGLRTLQTSCRLPNESAMPWFVMAAGLFLLGVNKQLDLQTAFIQLGGQLALQEGWYPQRRLVQFIFVLMLGAAMIAMALIAFHKQKHFFKNHPLVCLGGIVLAAFVFLRAAIFNHVDDDTGLGSFGGHWTDWLELTGIFCFIAGSLRVVKYLHRKH